MEESGNAHEHHYPRKAAQDHAEKVKPKGEKCGHRNLVNFSLRKQYSVDVKLSIDASIIYGCDFLVGYMFRMRGSDFRDTFLYHVWFHFSVGSFNMMGT